MALIICPNCGKSVSSTAAQCVHCGFGLKKYDEARNYHSLNSNEKDGLQKEFGALNPEFSEYKKEEEKNADELNKYSRVLRIMIIGGIIAVFVCFWAFATFGAKSGFFSMSISEKPVLLLPSICFVLCIGCWVGILALCIAQIFIMRRFNKRIAKNTLIIITIYKVWLKEAKNIDYEVTGIKDKYVDYIRDFEYDGVGNLKLERG